MQNKIYRAIFAAAAVLTLLCSCEKEIRFVGDYEGEKMVLYACANPESPLYVMVYKSKFILDPSDRSVFSLWSGAKVTGETGGKTIVFTEDGDRPGIYRSDYVPTPGETIALRASMNGVPDVSASATVPQKADYEIVSWSEEPCGEDEWYQHKVDVRVRLNDPAGEHNMYRFNAYCSFGSPGWYQQTAFTYDIHFRDAGETFSLIEEVFEGDTAVSIRDAVLEDSAFDGEALTFDLWFYIYDDGRYYWDYGDGEEEPEPWEFDPHDLAIGIDCLSEDLYLYTKTLASYNGSGLLEYFGEPVAIHNNISGGIGCFGAISPNIRRFDEE